MIATISNEYVTLAVDTLGAETKSLKDNHTGYEHLWQGHPDYWTGTNPILFPAVGGCWDGVYRHNGQQYRMPKHGFARNREWSVVESKRSSITLVYVPAAEDLEDFPFLCRVGVTYRLDNHKVIAEFTVENLGSTPLYFQMGGHPGINLPDFAPDRPVVGYIQLEGDPQSVLRATTQGCTAPDRFSYPQERPGLIPISVETFANEALIFDASQVHAATLYNLCGSRLARVESSAPVWLFWQPQGKLSPFICFEPWYGLCDSIGFDGPLSGRPYINCLPAQECWHGGYTLQVF